MNNRMIPLIRNADGTVAQRGLADKKKGKILSENSEALVVKWPGGQHWVGRGIMGYHRTETIVYQKVANDPNDPFVYKLISF